MVWSQTLIWRSQALECEASSALIPRTLYYLVFISSPNSSNLSDISYPPACLIAAICVSRPIYIPRMPRETTTSATPASTEPGSRRGEAATPEERSQWIGVAWWWWVMRKLREAAGWLDGEMGASEGPYHGASDSGERVVGLLDGRGEPQS